MINQMHIRAGLAGLLLAALCAIAALISVNQVSAETTDEAPGRVPCFTDIKPMVDYVKVSWPQPETGGAVKKWIIRLDPDDEDASAKVKRRKAKKTRAGFNNLEPGYYTISVQGKNDAGKGRPLEVRVEVGGVVNMIPANKICD